jgi:hypothetical protein
VQRRVAASHDHDHIDVLLIKRLAHQTMCHSTNKSTYAFLGWELQMRINRVCLIQVKHHRDGRVRQLLDFCISIHIFAVCISLTVQDLLFKNHPSSEVRLASRRMVTICIQVSVIGQYKTSTCLIRRRQRRRVGRVGLDVGRVEFARRANRLPSIVDEWVLWLRSSVHSTLHFCRFLNFHEATLGRNRSVRVILKHLKKSVRLGRSY